MTCSSDDEESKKQNARLFVCFLQEDEIMPAKFDEESLIWVAADQPLKDSSFLSAKIKDLCKDQPIFWLHPTYTNGVQKLFRLSCCFLHFLYVFKASAGGQSGIFLQGQHDGEPQDRITSD